MDRWYRTNRYLCASCLFVSFTVSLRMILMPTAGASRVRFKQMLRSRRVRAILYLCSCSCSHTRTRVCVGTHARTPTPISTCTPFSTRTPILYLSREKGSQEVTTDFAEVGGVVRHAGIKHSIMHALTLTLTLIGSSIASRRPASRSTEQTCRDTGYEQNTPTEVTAAEVAATEPNLVTEALSVA